jgi:cyclohexyl-isocyanide hydratase
VEASHERVCVDRNRISGGGVTAGVDFGLTVIAELKGQAAAELTQLALEYDPKPPFDSGHPRTAKAEIIALAEGVVAEVVQAGLELAKSYKRRKAGALGSGATSGSHR